MVGRLPGFPDKFLSRTGPPKPSNVKKHQIEMEKEKASKAKATKTLPRTGTRKRENTIKPKQPLLLPQNVKQLQPQPNTNSRVASENIGPSIKRARTATFTVHRIGGRKWVGKEPPTKTQLNQLKSELERNARLRKSRAHMVAEQAWQARQLQEDASKKPETKPETQKPEKSPKPPKSPKPANQPAAAIITASKLPNSAVPEPPKQSNGPIQSPRNKLNNARAKVSSLENYKAKTRSRIIELEKYEKDLRKRQKKLTKKQKKYEEKGPKQRSFPSKIGYFFSGKWILKSDKKRQNEKYNKRQEELEDIKQELEVSGNAKLELKQSLNNISTQLKVAKQVSANARKKYKGTRKDGKKSQNLESEPNKFESASSNV